MSDKPKKIDSFFAVQLRKLFGEEKGAPTLYHYTDSAGLIGIVESRSIWMSDFRCLGDIKELSYGLEICGDAWAKWPGLPTNEQLRDTLNLTVFTASFCENGNLLSQWRGYSKPNDGYAVGIAHFKPEKMRLRKVTYAPKLQVELFDEIGAVAHKRLQALTNPQERDEHFRTVLYLGFIAAAFCKDEVFSEEHEWRLVSIRGHLKEQFRVNAGHIVPYIAAPIGVESIVEVVQGPGNYRANNTGAVRRLLDSKNFTSAAVTKSRTPLG